MLSLLQGHVAMIYGVVSVFISPVTTKPGQDGKSGGTHLTLHMIMMWQSLGYVADMILSPFIQDLQQQLWQN